MGEKEEGVCVRVLGSTRMSLALKGFWRAICSGGLCYGRPARKIQKQVTKKKDLSGLERGKTSWKNQV